jgi:hypothetical protein
MKNESLPFNWLTIVFMPLCGIIAAFYTPLCLETAYAAVGYYFITGIAITAGRRSVMNKRP